MISIPEDIYKQASFAEGDEARSIVRDAPKGLWISRVVGSLSLYICFHYT